MIETQHGAAHYRVHPRAPHVLQVQPGPRLRWRTYARYRDADEARAALLLLARWDCLVAVADHEEWGPAEEMAAWLPPATGDEAPNA